MGRAMDNAAQKLCANFADQRLLINLFLNRNHILVQVQWRRHAIAQGMELGLRITNFNSSRKCQSSNIELGTIGP